MNFRAIDAAARSPAACDDSRREHERILRLAQWLDTPERSLIQAVYEEGKPLEVIAAARGTTRRALAGRRRRIVDRMNHPTFVWAAINADRLPAHLRAVARTCILRGRSMRAAAAEHGMSFHAVRRSRQTLLSMAAAGLNVDTRRAAAREGRA